MLSLRRSVFVARTFASARVAPRRGLEEFFDQNPIGKKVDAGRAWTASELRRKSFEDLHKLWYTCLKERNMLLTMMHDARSNKRKIDSPERMREVKLTMNHIQVVLGERQRARAEFVTEDIKKREAENLEKRRLEENAAQNTAATPPSA